MTLYVGNDQAVVIEGLRDPWASSGVGDDIDTASSASAQLYASDGTTAIGDPITLTNYQARNNVAGNYWVGVIEEDHAALVEGTQVVVSVTITASSDRVYSARQTHRVQRRT